MTTTWLIHYSQKRETPWAIAPMNKPSLIQYAEKVMFDVPCQTHEDYESKGKTWCFILAFGKLTWQGKVARIERDND